jgi:hypothetical protein
MDRQPDPGPPRLDTTIAALPTITSLGDSSHLVLDIRCGNVDLLTGGSKMPFLGVFKSLSDMKLQINFFHSLGMFKIRMK